MANQPSNVEIARMARPWYPAVSQVFQMSWRDAMAAVPILGIPRRGERANMVHTALRENFRRLCDDMEPFLTAVEEPEGKGLDYWVLDMGTPVALRVGKYNGQGVNRNDTARQTDIQEQGYLFGSADSLTSEDIPVVTFSYSVEDDYTEAGRPCAWMGRLVLIRERAEGSEFIEHVADFEKPATTEQDTETLAPRIVARQAEAEELRRIADTVRRRIA